MLKRLMSLTTLLVLCGVLALSVPAMADRNPQAAKATTPIVKVAVVKTTTQTSAIKSEFVRASWKDGLRFWLRNWLGRPYINIGDPKPPAKDEPLKSGTDPKKRNIWQEIARDHGGQEGA